MYQFNYRGFLSGITNLQESNSAVVDYLPPNLVGYLNKPTSNYLCSNPANLFLAVTLLISFVIMP